MRLLLLLLICSGLSPSATQATDIFSFKFEEIAENVWVGVRPDAPRYPVMGNVTFVISDAGVVVYDGGGMPAMADQVIQKIRSLTDLPVTDVIISHWHGDHNFGIYRFAEEYDNVRFIAHEFTQKIFNSSRINYIDTEEGFVTDNFELLQSVANNGVDLEGNKFSEMDQKYYQQIIADKAIIDDQTRKARVTPANHIITESISIQSGSRTIEILYLGHGNTEGDILMWLPDERIIATGDIVVLPSPYAFNVPLSEWLKTLKKIQQLNYTKLVPGHGPVQTNTNYMDLLITSVNQIVQQRDGMVQAGKSADEIGEALDFADFEQHFTGGDPYLAHFYQTWFVKPLRQAAGKELAGEPMVVPPPAITVPFSDSQWKINATDYEIRTYLGVESLKIKGGFAILPDLNLNNAMIEFDMAITKERGFAGAVFRLQDSNNYEHFYIRPHQSGNPDANQYTPVFNGNSGWQLYHGEDYASAVAYHYNRWIPVRIIYAGNKAQVYIDSKEPVVHIPDLKRSDFNGAIGVHSADFSAVHFANFRYTQLANAYSIPSSAAKQISKPGLITTWQVSEVISEQELNSFSAMSNDSLQQLAWQSLDAEPSGITNLGMLAARTEQQNTVFARYQFDAAKAQTVLFNFGYSDRARVYFNGKLIYQGNNGYMTRDYRYLGTIGLFDSVPLAVKPGNNDLLIAVSEDFGGWGIIGQLQSD